jgi:UDP:flavonoid glycosyltransferase YjiC (YdhE family)
LVYNASMKIVLATFGSRGDVQPMIALTLALQSAGHDARLAGPPEKASWIRDMGCSFHPLGRDLTSFIDSMKNAHSLSAATRFIRFLRDEIDSQFDSIPDMISGADLVLGASLVFSLSSISEAMGIRYRFIAFAPQLLPSSHHPFMAFKHQGLPEWMNRTGWNLAACLDKLNVSRLINRNRRKIGLAPVKSAWEHILGEDVILASDGEIAGVPPDSSISCVQTGHMHLVQPSYSFPELEAFLSAGPSPVYSGFGSMPKRDQANIVPLVVKAARNNGLRVVISKFWDEPSEFSGSEDVFFIQRYPHLDLFPRMAAVIHHGGAGTTATTARSGVPQIIVPHILDQYYWGNQIHQLQLGPKPIWRSRLTAEKLSRAIKESVTNQEMMNKVARMGKTLRRKDPLGIAVREIERRGE